MLEVSKMLKRDLVISALEHKAGPVPHNITYTEAYIDKARAEIGNANLDELFENMILLSKYKRTRKISENIEIDIMGLKWNKDIADGGDIGMPIDPPIKSADLADGEFDGYKVPSPDLEFARAQAKKLEDDTQGMFRMFGITFALYERAWGLRGMADLLMDFILEPEFARTLFERITEHHLLILDAVLGYDYEAVYFADDWGSQQRLIMGADTWRKFIAPCFRRIAEKVKSKGKYLILHSCGNNIDIIGDWIDMGVDCYQTVQPEIYDLKKLKREFGAHMSFYGAISTQQFLPFATAAQVKDECLRVMDILAEDGGYILSPTHSITPDIPIENALAIIEAAKNYTGK